jgi:hypothetical protein
MEASMKRSIPVLLALTVGCATGVVVRDVVAPVRAQGQAGPNYEYDVVKVESEDKEVLLKYGRQGWRLAAAFSVGSGHYLYLERQLPR